jgi:hypothetical protein
VRRGHEDQFEDLLADCTFASAGRITDDNQFRVIGLSGEPIITVATGRLKEAWQKPLRW